jgi:Tfp pilus assembly protein PilV
MKRMARLIAVILFSLVALGLVSAQTQANQKKAATSQKAKGETLELGKSYAALRPEQKHLVDDFVHRYNATTGSKLVPPKEHFQLELIGIRS